MAVDTSKSRIFSTRLPSYERRNNLHIATFPLTDSFGHEITNDRRNCPSVYLKRIKVEEISIHEAEFNKLFNNFS